MKKICSIYENGKIVFSCCLLLAVLFYNGVALSEMRITTDDGRVIKVPINRNEVKKIEYVGETHANYRDIGCFYDYKDGVRDLSGYSVSNAQMTTEQCVSTCREKGFAYAGTQYSSYCFCGNSYGKFGNASESGAKCDMKCTGDPNQICGGSYANSIYSIR